MLIKNEKHTQKNYRSEAFLSHFDGLNENTRLQLGHALLEYCMCFYILLVPCLYTCPLFIGNVYDNISFATFRKHLKMDQVCISKGHAHVNGTSGDGEWNRNRSSVLLADGT